MPRKGAHRGQRYAVVPGLVSQWQGLGAGTTALHFDSALPADDEIELGQRLRGLQRQHDDEGAHGMKVFTKKPGDLRALKAGPVKQVKYRTRAPV